MEEMGVSIRQFLKVRPRDADAGGVRLVPAHRWIVFLAVACAAGLAASPATSSHARTPNAAIALGVAVSDPGAPSALAQYSTLIGRRPAIVTWFQNFGEPLYYPDQKAAVDAAGVVPMITWEPTGGTPAFSLAEIAAGADDAYVRGAAAAAAAWRKPVFIRFAPEMNLQGVPWGPAVAGNTPAVYVAAWRHVVAIFRGAGATNVRWLWSPNANCGGRCPFDAFYPGDRWVDWVALDGYNYSSTADDRWMSMAQIFASSYRDLVALTKKPVLIAETGSVEVGGNKAAWITQSFLHTLPRQFPRVRAVLWWQHDDAQADWRVNSSPAALAAFRAVASSPLYSAGPGALVGTPPSAHR